MHLVKTVRLWSQTLVVIMWLAAALAIAVGSLSPRLAPPGELGLDKIIHFGAYAFLAFGPALTLERGGARWLFLGLTLLLGWGLEFAQAGIPGRSFSLNDGVANMLGVLSGTLAAVMVRSMARRWARS